MIFFFIYNGHNFNLILIIYVSVVIFILNTIEDILYLKSFNLVTYKFKNACFLTLRVEWKYFFIRSFNNWWYESCQIVDRPSSTKISDTIQKNFNAWRLCHCYGPNGQYLSFHGGGNGGDERHIVYVDKRRDLEHTCFNQYNMEISYLRHVSSSTSFTRALRIDILSEKILVWSVDVKIISSWPNIDWCNVQTYAGSNQHVLSISRTAGRALYLSFSLFLKWHFTLISRHIVLVVPIYKKEPSTETSNCCPISLTLVIKKLFKKCLQPKMQDSFWYDSMGGFIHSETRWIKFSFCSNCDSITNNMPTSSWYSRS